MSDHNSHDVVVIGGGPAGATVAPLLKNAEEQSVAVHEGVRVHDVLFEEDRAVGVQVTDEAGNLKEVRASVVVDASGQSSLLINKFKLRVPDAALNKGALWTYFKGAYRDQGKDEGATIVLSLRDKQGWFWYIPMRFSKACETGRPDGRRSEIGKRDMSRA